MVDRAPDGRVAVVTGVSRRVGIGFAIARRLLEDGARVLLHSFSPYDAEPPGGADGDEMAALLGELGGESERLRQIEADLGDLDTPRRVVERAVDALVANHAHGSTVDTGWPSAELRERLRPAFPAGRWGRPDDVAAIIAWMVSPENAWLTGQVIDAEGGFRPQDA
jgi:NAD(P)-dependent dehydrogenase (short-subunit alcohol dehydrogenase family)